MTIDLTVPGDVNILMYDYVQKLTNKLGVKPTAAPKQYLFKTNDDEVERLEKDKADKFHTLTTIVLYLGQRAGPDLQLAVSFLCTRVKNPDVHDWKKLTHLMKYLQGTAFCPMIFGIVQGGNSKEDILMQDNQIWRTTVKTLQDKEMDILISDISS